MTTLHLRIGAAVYQEDRRIGSLTALLLDPADGAWHGIVVRAGGTEQILPRAAVQQATDEQIAVDQHGLHPAPAPSLVRIDARTPILAANGRRAGRFQMLQAGPDGQPCALVMARGLFRGTVLLPAEVLRSVTDRGIEIDLPPAAVDALEPYRPDPHLTVAARWEIERQQRIHRQGYTGIDVSSSGGIVTLTGNVASLTQARRIASAVAAIPGVLGVRNLLVTDEELLSAARYALAADQRTAAIDAGVSVDRGVVTLTGRSPDAASVALAGRIVLGLPGVRDVDNHLRSPERRFFVPVGRPADGEREAAAARSR